MRRKKWFLKYVIATTLVVAIGVALIKAADAGSRNVDRSWSGTSGSGALSKSVTSGNGSRTRDVTRTGPNGNSLQRNTQRTYQEGAGTTYDNTTTLPSGSTVMRQRSVTPTEDGVTVNRQITGPEGNTGSVTRSYDAR
jgi:hypothetical protein